MEVELIEIRNFIAEHPPFSFLASDVLDELPKSLLVRHFRKGTPFPPDQGQDKYLFILRKGAIEFRDKNDSLVSKLDQGDICTSACIPQALEAPFAGVIVEDCSCFLLPCEQLTALRTQHPDFDRHFSESLNERLQQAVQSIRRQIPSGIGFTDTRITRLINRPPQSISPAATIKQAATKMEEQNVSSLLIMQNQELLGIITDHDLRNRCIAAGINTSTPVSSIMTSKLHTIFTDGYTYDALLKMIRQNVKHLPVMELKNVVGVVSVTDLIRNQTFSALHLVKEIRKCENVTSLLEKSRNLPELQAQLFSSGVPAEQLCQTIATVTDTITHRLIELAQHKIGPAPVDFAWLAVGSQARHEQTVYSDQDNALLLSDNYNAKAHSGYFEEFARFVCDALDACGFRYCPGDIMASNPQWRQPLKVWRKYFTDWIRSPERKALMLSCNFHDMRVVYGDNGLLGGLCSIVLPLAAKNQIYLAHMAANAISHTVPLGFFRNLVLTKEGEHQNAVDIKLGGILPITHLARVYALSAALSEINTKERLLAASEAGVLSSEGADNLKDALVFLNTLRIRHQVNCCRQKRPLNNHIEPELLSQLERQHLKDVFHVIRAMQDALNLRYLTGMIG